MKLRLPVIIIFVAIMAAIWAVQEAFADPGQALVWNTPYGLFNVNPTTSEELIGYDAILKQAVGGIAQPIYTDPKGIITIHLGGVAPWPVGNQATIQPLIAAGHNILKELIPSAQAVNVQMNVFARYVPGNGKAGMGVVASYAPGGAPALPAATVAPDEPSPTSRLNLYQTITGV